MQPITLREVLGIFVAALITAVLINSAIAKNSEGILSVIASEFQNIPISNDIAY
jgi:hypothetical protein